MNKLRWGSFFILILILLTALSLSGVAGASSPPSKFFANLSGDEEVPPRETQAHGKAKFHLSEDASELEFKLKVTSIQNVFAAHIHCGAVGVNGPVGVTLFRGAPGGGRFSGILARGSITAPDTGNACGWMTLADVVAAMRSGNTYVNVHTNDGIDPPNTGPGDFPGGEIRGQVQERGSTP